MNENLSFPTMADDALQQVFNPSWNGFLINSLMDEQEKEQKHSERTIFETRLYEEICIEIEKDMQQLGIPVTFATKILINELAFNIILLSRVKFQINNRELLQEEQGQLLKYVLGEHFRDAKTYSYDTIFKKETVHPLFDTFIFRLQKQINFQLHLLGLLPEQQLQRQKVQIIQKYKKKLFEIRNQEESLEISTVMKEKI